MKDKEIAIIKKAQAGDESAFKWIFKRYKGLVEGVLYDYLNDRDEARDITNVVFLKVYNKLSMFSVFDSFGGWLRTLTSRVAIDYLRTKGNHRYIFVEDDSELLSDDDDQVEYETVNRMTVERIFEALDRYPPHVRKIFELHYMYGMSVEMVSSKLRIPTGTIKSILSRVRNKLKKKLKR